MARLWYNFISGVLEEQMEALFAHTTMKSAGLTGLPELGGGDYVVAILGSNTITPEVVHITSHAAGTDTATVVRGQENTSPRTWQVDTLWHHGQIASDLEELRGPTGLTGPAWDAWQGVWAAGTAYSRLDAVSHADASWIANADTVAGEEPGVSGKWDLIAQKGSVENIVLDDLTNVDTTGKAANDAVIYDGSSFVAGKPTPNTHGKSRHSDPGVGSLGTTGATAIDLNTVNTFFTQNLTGDPTYSTTNRAAGRSATIRINPGASARTPTFPGWRFFGTAPPDTFEANTMYILTLTAWGPNETDIDAAIAAEVP